MVDRRRLRRVILRLLFLETLLETRSIGGIRGTPKRVPKYADMDGTHRTPRLYGRRAQYGADYGMSGGCFYYHFRFDRSDIPRLVKARGRLERLNTRT